MTAKNITLLDEKEVSKALKLSLATLRRWRWLKTGPKFIKIGSSVRYRETDIEAFLNELATAEVIAPERAA